MTLLIDILGWKQVDQKTIDKIRNTDRMILVYPHTTCMDYLFYLLYNISYPELKERARVIMDHRVFHSLGPLTRCFGAIPSTTKIGKGGTGTINMLYEELSKMEKFIYIVSPKGSTNAKSPWHKGYYVLAKKLKCAIAVGGFDFEERKFVIKEPFYIKKHESFDEITYRCQQQMGDITPAYPWKVEYPLDDYEKSYSITMTDFQHFLAFLVFLVLIILVVTLLIIFTVKFFTRMCRNSNVLIA